jgi:hypothetical protein
MSGNGVYFDRELNSGTVLPIQIANLPREASAFGRTLNRLPGTTDLELSAVEVRKLARQNGNLVMNWALSQDGSEIGNAMYYWGGAHDGWRLFNNAPTLSSAQRDARSGWVQGDIIYNSDSTVQALQVWIGTTWKTIALS